MTIMLSVAFISCNQTNDGTNGGSGSNTETGTGSGDTEKTYTIRFKSNGGSSVKKVTVKEGELISRPEDPEKGMWTFGGWFTYDERYEWMFELDTAYKNMTLYAKWLDNKGSIDNFIKVKYDELEDWLDDNAAEDISYIEITDIPKEALASKIVGYNDTSGDLATKLSSKDPAPKVYIRPVLKDNEKLTEIPTWSFLNAKGLVGIDLPETVTKIGEKAFYGCDSLKHINFPEKLETIGKDAFASCKSLQKLTFPASLQSLGETIFWTCEGLRSVDLSACTELKIISEELFVSCSHLEWVKLPPNLTEIGKEAFRGCDISKDIDLSEYEKLEIINKSAFEGNEHLESITFPESLEELWGTVFRSCKELSKVDFSLCKNLTTLGNKSSYQIGLFTYCDKIKSVDLSACVKLKTLRHSVFCDAEGLKDVKLPPELEKIEENVFAGCGSLTSIYLPNTLTEIGEGAFSACKKLESLTLPAKLTKIGEGAFQYCEKLKTIDISKCTELKKIESSTFDSCTSLENIDMQNCIAIDEIDEDAFKECTSLLSVNLPPNIIKFGNEAFYECSKLGEVDLAVCKTLNYDECGKGIFSACSSLKNIKTDEANSTNGVWLNADKSILYGYPAGKEDKKYELPASVTEIKANAFETAVYLEDFTLEETTKLKTIENDAFTECKALANVDLSKCGTNNLEIRHFAFQFSSNAVITLPTAITLLTNSRPFGYPYYAKTLCKKVRVPNDTVKQAVLKADFPKDRIEPYTP